MKYGSSAYPASADSYEFGIHSLSRLRERAGVREYSTPSPAGGRQGWGPTRLQADSRCFALRALFFIMKYGSSAYPASSDSYEFGIHSLSRLRERAGVRGPHSFPRWGKAGMGAATPCPPVFIAVSACYICLGGQFDHQCIADRYICTQIASTSLAFPFKNNSSLRKLCFGF